MLMNLESFEGPQSEGQSSLQQQFEVNARARAITQDMVLRGRMTLQGTPVTRMIAHGLESLEPQFQKTCWCDQGVIA